ncbi:hypothetical protein LINGRAHAP2_LOCUS32124 [Linum grandiflorum]
MVRNPGRRFFRCQYSKERGNDCKFFQWVDETEFCRGSVSASLNNGFREELPDMESRLRLLQDSLDRLAVKITEYNTLFSDLREIKLR